MANGVNLGRHVCFTREVQAKDFEMVNTVHPNPILAPPDDGCGFQKF